MSYSDLQDKVWFDRFLPAKGQALARLARFDRPIGAWLLLIPGLWSIWLAGHQVGADLGRLLWISFLFWLGALVLRGAGCVVNDMWDRDLDARVERTASRPLASGAITMLEAWIFLGVLLGIGLVVVLLLPRLTIALAALSLVFVALYPLAKRVTFWPQVMLGLTFSFGALIGWAAVTSGVSWTAALVYAACIIWTVGYDTIYAHQDREDDKQVGIKSTAILFEHNTPTLLRVCFGLTTLFLALALWRAAVGPLAWLGLAGAVATMIWQVRSFDAQDRGKCLALFKFSAWTGWLLLAGLLSDYIMSRF